MNRNDVTEMIITAKVKKGLKWAEIAAEGRPEQGMGNRRLPGPDALDEEQAESAARSSACRRKQMLLQIVPYKGSLPTAVPTDPLIYRWYEIVNVYGTTIKELIHEEFGDGIMSAIDFNMDIQREPDPKGDRVNIVMSGKFLPYKTY